MTSSYDSLQYKDSFAHNGSPYCCSEIYCHMLLPGVWRDHFPSHFPSEYIHYIHSNGSVAGLIELTRSHNSPPFDQFCLRLRCGRMWYRNSVGLYKEASAIVIIIVSIQCLGNYEPIDNSNTMNQRIYPRRLTKKFGKRPKYKCNACIWLNVKICIPPVTIRVDIQPTTNLAADFQRITANTGN